MKRALEAVLARGFIPIIDHGKLFYSAIEQYPAKIDQQILDKPAFGFVIDSQAINAHCITTPELHAVVVSNTLIRRYLGHVWAILRNEELQSAYSDVTNSDDLSRDFLKVMMNITLDVLHFVMGHEIAHLHFGHIGVPWSQRPTLSPQEPAAAAAALQEYGGGGNNSERRIDELQSDRASASFLLNLVVQRHIPVVVTDNGPRFVSEIDASDLSQLKSDIAKAMIAMLIAILSASPPESDFDRILAERGFLWTPRPQQLALDLSKDHPAYDARISWAAQGLELYFQEPVFGFEQIRFPSLSALENWLIASLPQLAVPIIKLVGRREEFVPGWGGSFEVIDTKAQIFIDRLRDCESDLNTPEPTAEGLLHSLEEEMRWRNAANALEVAAARFGYIASVKHPSDEGSQAEFLTTVSHTYGGRGDVEHDGTLLLLAAAAQRAAMEVEQDAREILPILWILRQNEFAINLARLGNLERDAKWLKEAVSGLREALSVLTSLGFYEQSADYKEWLGRTNLNLGNTLRILAAAEESKLWLWESVAATRSAIRAYDAGTQGWAAAQGNLGLALLEIAHSDAGATRLQAAIAAFRRALAVWKRDGVAEKYAAQEVNLRAAFAILRERAMRSRAQSRDRRLRSGPRFPTRLPKASSRSVRASLLKLFDSDARRGASQTAMLPTRTSRHAKLEDLVDRFGAPPELSVREWVARCHFNKGIALGALGRHEEAIAFYDTVVDGFGAAPELSVREWVARAYFNKGIALGELERHEEAIAVYDTVVDSFGAAPELSLRECVANSLLNKGVRLDALGRSTEELAVYDDIVTRFSASPELSLRERIAGALAYKAITLDALGRSTEELAVYDDIVNRFGASLELPLRERVAEALAYKAIRLDALGHSREEIAIYDEIIDRFGVADELSLRERVANALFDKGVTLGQLDHSEEAIAVYDSVVDRFSTASELPLLVWAAKALGAKGSRLSALGRNADAIAIYTKLLYRLSAATDPSLCELKAMTISMLKSLRTGKMG